MPCKGHTQPLEEYIQHTYFKKGLWQINRNEVCFSCNAMTGLEWSSLSNTFHFRLVGVSSPRTSSSTRSCSAKTNLFALLYAMKKQLFNPPEASKKFLWAIHLARKKEGFFQRKWEKSTCGFVLKTSCSSLLWQKRRRLLLFEAVAIQKERHKNCLEICLMNWWANRKFLQKIKTERRSESKEAWKINNDLFRDTTNNALLCVL